MLVNKSQLIALLLPLMLVGCATFSSDGGFGAVEKTTQNYIKQKTVWATSEAQRTASAQQATAMLEKPLSVDDAVQVALLNNAQLQADYYQLQIAEADMVQAGRLPNPSFSMLFARNNGDYKIEQVVTLNILALFTIPKATEIEKKRFAAAQNTATLRVLELAYQTRNAYINALAATESVNYLEKVKRTAEATTELAKRMNQAGNWSALDQAREQSFYADATIDLARAENQCVQMEENLTQLLGLKNRSDFKLPERLPDLPKSSESLKQVSAEDFSKRLDLQQTKENTEALALQLGLTKATRFVNVLELGPARVLEGRRGESYKKGFSIGFELPIFDWGAARVKRAEATYMQAVNEAKANAITAASEVRGSYNQYLSSFELAKQYRDEIVPLRKRILQENQLRYNGMLIGPFELLADARAQVLSVNSYLEALRDFWLAESNLDMSLIGKPLNAGEF
ncbi:MAG: TolC family protein [Methylotenera sp.]